MTGHSPNFDEWRMRDSMSVYEIACLMNGYDPRAMADAVVRDPANPTSPHGIPLDTAWDEDSLLSALDAGTLHSAPLNVIKPDKRTRISVESLVPWLRSKGYGDLAAELDAQESPSIGSTSAGPDFEMLATRQQLIDAFGSFTDMNFQWFNNLKDTPALRDARQFTGQGGRGHIAEPLFCPFAVMRWLTDPKRKKGRSITEDTAWRMLETHFSKVYNANSVADPRPS